LISIKPETSHPGYLTRPGRVEGMHMSTFFLHIRDGDELICDPDGSSFHNLEAARREAIACARELMAEGILDGGHIGVERSIVICDVNGRTLLVLPFRQAIASNLPRQC
jgi:hypothetical protein